MPFEIVQKLSTWIFLIFNVQPKLALFLLRNRILDLLHVFEL